jgi:hypothetical protein
MENFINDLEKDAYTLLGTFMVVFILQRTQGWLRAKPL